jgi:hypothetical protein
MDIKNSTSACKVLICLIIILATGQNSIAQRENRLLLRLSKGVFSQDYQLILKDRGSDDVNDADALQVSEGFVAIAGLTAAGKLLSIDERATDTATKTISLYTKVWEPGRCVLALHGAGPFLKSFRVELVDHLLNLSKKISAADSLYTFHVQWANEEAERRRFSIRLRPNTSDSQTPGQETSLRAPVPVYPNPFDQVIYIDTDNYDQPVSVVLRDYMGRKIWNGDFSGRSGIREIPARVLPPGWYFVEVSGKTGRRPLHQSKMIKHQLK